MGLHILPWLQTLCGGELDGVSRVLKLKAAVVHSLQDERVSKARSFDSCQGTKLCMCRRRTSWYPQV